MGGKPFLERRPGPIRISPFPIRFLRLALHRREEAEIDVHGLEALRVRAARDVAQKRAQGRRRRGRGEDRAKPLGRGEAPGQEPDRGALDIALYAGDLAGEADARL